MPGSITPRSLDGHLPKLLIADDESVIRTHLGVLGEKLGFQVREAKDGLEAWSLYQAFQPDIVITDIYMPGMNGLAVLAKIKEISPGCPVILITGFLHYSQLVETGRLKPDGCILKPLNLQNTGELILKLAGRNLGQEN